MNTDTNLTNKAVTFDPVRLLLCVLPDDGTDHKLIEALRNDHGINVADSIACRGVSILGETKTKKSGQLPESTFIKLLQVCVPEASADTLFDYIYINGKIDRPRGGMIIMSKPVYATPFHLPDNVQNKEM